MPNLSIKNAPDDVVGRRAPLATFDRALGNAARKVLAG
jgi:hypothetical protein